jgi:hypothetical protein
MACHCVPSPPLRIESGSNGLASFVLPALGQRSSRGAGKSRADGGEGIVDTGRQARHAGRSKERDQRNDECIFDQILPLVTVENVLDLDRDGVRIQAQQGWCFSVDFPRSGDLSLQSPSYSTHAGPKPK